MTETATAETLFATPLAAHLQAARPDLKLTAYRGVLTAAEFPSAKLDAPQTETAALAHGAAVHDLGWLRGVRVRGEDRFRWLSGMVTNTVNDLKPGTGAWNLVLNAQGRIQGDLIAWRFGDHLSLEITADQSEKLVSHLDHFIIMDDVELQPLEGVTTIGLTGPKAGEVLERIGIATHAEPLTESETPEFRVFRGYGVLADHYKLWGTVDSIAQLWDRLVEAGAAPVGATALEAFRIAEGIPVYGIDIAERDLPQEVVSGLVSGQAGQLNALHFSKGCYLGQEIVERIRSRGNVHRHLRQVELDGPLPAAGMELRLEGAAEAAGTITSAAELPLAAGTRRFALAMIQAKAEAEAELKKLPLTYTTESGAGTARILTAPPVL